MYILDANKWFSIEKTSGLSFGLYLKVLFDPHDKHGGYSLEI